MGQVMHFLRLCAFPPFKSAHVLVSSTLVPYVGTSSREGAIGLALDDLTSEIAWPIKVICGGYQVWQLDARRGERGNRSIAARAFKYIINMKLSDMPSILIMPFVLSRSSASHSSDSCVDRVIKANRITS